MEGTQNAKSAKVALTTWQWLTLIATICSTGVIVTVFAFQTFEAKGAAAAVEDKTDRRLRRIEWKQDQIMLHFQIQPKPMPLNMSEAE